MTYQVKTALLYLCVASLTLTACGPRFHNAHVSADCMVYTQSCAPNNYQRSRYGYVQNQPEYQQSGYEAYGSEYIQSYPAPAPVQYPATPYPPAVTYVQSQQSLVSYVPTPAPTPTPIHTPTYEPAPIYDYQPEPIVEPSQPLSSWAAPWREESGCPEGTIQGYGGGGCVQVTVLRK